MKLTWLSIKRPIAMTMILAALCLLGGVSYTQLAVKRLPDVNFPHVSISVSYPGASSESIRTQVVEPIENVISSIGGIDTVTSKERNGRGRVSIRFIGGLDVNKKAAEVAHAVDSISGSFPSDVPAPTIIKANPDAFPILTVVVSGNSKRADLYNLVTDAVQPAIARVPGVALVSVAGGRQPQINISVKPELMNQYGVTLNDIARSLSSANKSVPGGVLQSKDNQITIVTSGLINKVDDFKTLTVWQTPGGTSVQLQQVADVSLGYAPIQTESTLDGRTAMSLDVTAGSTANLLTVSNGVHAAVRKLQSSMSDGVQIKILDDLTDDTRHALTAVQTDLFFAILVASLVLAVFLRRLRHTLIVVLAIPSSLLMTGLLMYAMHFSLDTISLMALSLLIGILVDDAVVVLENIDRHHKMGKPAIQAAMDGRTEIGWAAIAITLTDVVVYAPVAYMQGNVGQLFREFGLVIVFASLFSLFVSFTLTPMLAAHWLKKERIAPKPERKAGPVYLQLQNGYTRLQRIFVRHWFLSVLLLVLCGMFINFSFNKGWVQTVYTPNENESVFSVKVTMPTGTAEEVTKQAVGQLSQEIQELPDVQSVLATTGFGGGSVSGSDIGRIVVQMNSGGRTSDTTAAIDGLANQIPGVAIQTSTPNPMLAESGGTIHVILSGTNLNSLNQLAERVQTMMDKTPGITNIQSSAEKDTPVLSIVPNDRAAALYGLTAAQVGRSIRIAVQGNKVSQFIPAGSLKGEPVVVQMEGGRLLNMQQMKSVPVGRYNGNVVHLGEVASISQGKGPAGESEVDRQLQISIIGNASDSQLGTIARILKQEINKMGLPAGYSFKLAGAVEQKTKAFKPLLHALQLSVVLIYMLLAALYESFFDPLLVILMLPFAATGGIAALVLTGTPFSLYAFIAMIMLMGLVAKNAILLVDYAKIQRAQGMSPKEALLSAGQVRLRPILMTTVTMVLAMIPLALPVGTGSADRTPIALVLIGGLSLSTVLTLLVLPVFYTYMWSFQTTVGGWLKKRVTKD